MPSFASLKPRRGAAGRVRGLAHVLPPLLLLVVTSATTGFADGPRSFTVDETRSRFTVDPVETALELDWGSLFGTLPMPLTFDDAERLSGHRTSPWWNIV